MAPPIDVDVLRLRIPPNLVDILTRPPPLVVVGTGGSPDIRPQERPRTAFHHITVAGTTTFHDYETFGPDEHGTFPFRQETVLATNDIGITILSWQRGFGGEERVELKMTGSLRNDGVLSASLECKFFEGATEGTTELEDTEGWNTVVHVDGGSNFNIHLMNDEDDWADVVGTISNRRL